jgi:hypothetical protein
VLQATERSTGGIRAADVDPVDDSGQRVPVDEQLAHVEVAVAHGRVTSGRESLGGAHQRGSVDPELAEARHANGHVRATQWIERKLPAHGLERLRLMQRS